MHSKNLLAININLLVKSTSLNVQFVNLPGTQSILSTTEMGTQSVQQEHFR